MESISTSTPHYSDLRKFYEDTIAILELTAQEARDRCQQKRRQPLVKLKNVLRALGMALVVCAGVVMYNLKPPL